MKKIMFLPMTLVFIFTFCVAHAYQVGNGQNCVTDFTGQTYDSVPILCGEVSGVMQSLPMEGSGAGGIPIVQPSNESDNGATDFTGWTYDAGPVLGLETAVAMQILPMEGSGAGGIPVGQPSIELKNGATDFTGRTYDSGP